MRGFLQDVVGLTLDERGILITRHRPESAYLKKKKSIENINHWISACSYPPTASSN